MKKHNTVILLIVTAISLFVALLLNKQFEEERKLKIEELKHKLERENLENKFEQFKNRRYIKLK